jgi:hypothetical protein
MCAWKEMDWTPPLLCSAFEGVGSTLSKEHCIVGSGSHIVPSPGGLVQWVERVVERVFTQYHTCARS